MELINFLEVFSPAIMETTVPKEFVDIINSTGDEILSSKEKSIEWDYSNNLVGKVNKEIQIPIHSDKDRDLVIRVMRQGCLDYLKYIISKNKADNWYKLAGGDVTPAIDNIAITSSWIVSQYAGEYNPYHSHSGDFSAVVYLKLPPKMQEEIENELKDHAPSNGLIEFIHGEDCAMRHNNVKFVPEVGKMLMFPSYLKHFVYPFYSEGERRSMSFNADMIKGTD